MSMKLITETNDFTTSMIVENTAGGKQYFFEGKYIQTEIRNRNGRIYSCSEMEQEVARYVAEKVEPGKAVGELGHPPTPTIDYNNACHKIVSLVQEGTDWIGRSKVLTSLPKGMIVKGLIDEGVVFGTSTRGIGGLRQNTSKNITEVYNYKISTAGDVVSDPSAPDAFVRGIMEGAEWIYDASADSYVAAAVVERIKESFKHTPHSKIDEERKLKAFNAFLSKI